MFHLLAFSLVLFSFLTLRREYKLFGGVSLLSLLTVGNFMYGGLTPIIAFYWPVGAFIFDAYVRDAGMIVDASGLINVIIIVILFQLSLWIASLRFVDGRSISFKSRFSLGNPFSIASILIGLVVFFLGLAGVVWVGLVFNGSVGGLFDIPYEQRSPFFRGNPLPAFLLLIGLFGVAQLMVTLILVERFKAALVTLFLLIAYSLAVGSKLPLLWGVIVFLFTAMNCGVRLGRVVLPAVLSILVLASLSGVRSGVPFFQAAAQGGFEFWNNDIPGPSSITYFLINSGNNEFTLDPLVSIFRILVPSFVSSRGQLLPDVWAEKMVGSNYESGIGFGWSVLLDAYLFLGFFGVFFTGYLLGRTAIYLDAWRSRNPPSFMRLIILNCSAPLFFLCFRESIAGAVKTAVVLLIVIWIPTFCVAKTGVSKRHLDAV